MMKKNALKYGIDALLFINISSVAAVGMLIGFVIPKGEYRHSGNTFLGLHRHEWSDIHLYLSIFLLILLTIHLSFNWAWIIQSTKKYFAGHWKKAFYILAGSWILVIIICWIAVKMR
jgi:hypothetical protein